MVLLVLLGEALLQAKTRRATTALGLETWVWF